MFISKSDLLPSKVTWKCHSPGVKAERNGTKYIPGRDSNRWRFKQIRIQTDKYSKRWGSWRDSPGFVTCWSWILILIWNQPCPSPTDPRKRIQNQSCLSPTVPRKRMWCVLESLAGQERVVHVDLYKTSPGMAMAWGKLCFKTEGMTKVYHFKYQIKRPKCITSKDQSV